LGSGSRPLRLAVLAFVLLALIWGYAWVVMKVAIGYTEPFTFAALRAAISAAFMIVLLPVLRRPMKPRALGLTALLGLLQTTGFAGLMMWALENGGAGKTSVLTYTMPFWLLPLAWVVLGEKMRGLKWLAVALALGGLILILSPWQLRGVWSSAMAVGAGFCWAASTVVAKVIHKRHAVDLFSLVAWQMLLGAVPLAIVALLTTTEAPVWSASFIWALGYSALLGNCLAWILWLFVLTVLPAGTTGLASLATPVLGVLFAWVQLGERPGLAEALGMTLIVAGLAVLTIREAKHRNGAATAESMVEEDRAGPL
jgi:drug/metabolite transporter (DMT)-like permease